MRIAPAHRVSRLVAAALLAALLPACSVFRGIVGAPVDAFEALFSGDEAAPNLAGMQVGLQRFADEFMNELAGELDEYARKAGTPEARSQAMRWKVQVAASVIAVASGPNPVANLCDILVLSTLAKLVFETHASQAADPAAFQGLVDASRGLEQEAWKLGRRVLDEPKRQQLRELVDEWREKNPEGALTFFSRPREITSVIRQAGRKNGDESSSRNVLGFIGLDPLSSLDPAVREVTESRLVAERALFTAQRMPILLQWQVELLSDGLLRRPELKDVTVSADRIGRAAESIGETAARLPEDFAKERAALVGALETHEGKLADLSQEIRRTLEAGAAMSNALDKTIVTFDGLMARFGVGEPDPPKPPGNDAGREARPFDIREYTRAAEQLTAAATELGGMLREARQTVDSPVIERRIDDAKSVVDRAFLFAGGLVVLAFACALAYRRLRRA